MHRNYTSCTVYVFNKPSRDNLSEYEKAIIRGLQVKWSENHQDPHLKRFKIIFVDHNSFPSPEIFVDLQKVDRCGLVYLIGHSSPGSNSLYSDLDAYQRGKRVEFKSEDIVYSMMPNLRPNNDLVRGHSEEKDDILFGGRLLRVVIGGCYSATPSKDSPALASKMLQCFFENGIACEVVGQNGTLMPIGSESSLVPSLKFLFNTIGEEVAKRYLGISFTGFFNIPPGFHKRIFDVRDKEGNRILRNKFPYHKNGDYYKIIFKMVPSQNGGFEVKPLSVSEDRENYKIQSKKDPYFTQAFLSYTTSVLLDDEKRKAESMLWINLMKMICDEQDEETIKENFENTLNKIDNFLSEKSLSNR